MKYGDKIDLFLKHKNFEMLLTYVTLWNTKICLKIKKLINESSDNIWNYYWLLILSLNQYQDFKVYIIFMVIVID